MNALTIGIYAISILASLGILVFITFAFVLFFLTTCRNPFKKRKRECSNKKDAANVRMFAEGTAWAEQYNDKIEQLQIVSGSLKLYGQYINFGFNKCCMVIQGRAESLLQSYYFADVYAKNGYNILVIDVRAHGLSDGIYQTGGIKESDDLLLWIKLINEKYKITDFTIHGVCLGAAIAIYTYSKLKKEGNKLVKRIVTDGLYESYFELYKGHIKAFSGWSINPAIYATFFLIFIFAGFNPFKANPIDYIKDIDIPVLFIWSTMDQFCPRLNSEELFKACVSEYKEICLFNKGRHAHIRAAQKNEYDEIIAKFLQKHI